MQPGSTSLRLPQIFPSNHGAPVFHPQRGQELWEKSCQVTGKKRWPSKKNLKLCAFQHGLLIPMSSWGWYSLHLPVMTPQRNPTNTYPKHLKHIWWPGWFLKNALLDLDIMTRRAKQLRVGALEIMGCNLAMPAGWFSHFRFLHYFTLKVSVLFGRVKGFPSISTCNPDFEPSIVCLLLVNHTAS